MTEVEYGGLVRQRLRQAQAHEPPDRIGLVEQILHTRVAEIVEELDTVNPQHNCQRVGSASLACLGVVGADSLLQRPPGDETFHPLQEQLPAGPALLALILQISKSGLVHLHYPRAAGIGLVQLYYATCQSLFRESLGLP